MRIWRFHNLVAKSEGLSPAEVAQVQREAKTLVSDCMECDVLRNAFDRPTGHNVLELAERDLPDMQTVHLTKCGSMEAAHAPLKCEDPRMWRTMLARETTRRSLRMVLQGRSWVPVPGEDRVRAGRQVRRAYRENVRGFGRIPDDKHPPYVQSGGWRPIAYTTPADAGLPHGFDLDEHIRGKPIMRWGAPP